ncbi:MAG: hypothetical protein GY829_08230 [Gammaproteobacteria bacterium]|nr:hypothetical protein [Gammaproteobacteria bacterium]
MNLQGLSFDSMPPLAVPYQFFITAPLAIIAIGLLWLFATPVEFISRWSNLLLASTHGITLGFMLMVMLGALFQVLPVVTGIAMPKATKLSKVVYLFLLIGVICLVFGFAFRQNQMLGLGAIAVLIALIVFVSGLFISFPQMRNTPTSWAIRLASVSLLITIGLGVAFIAAWLEPSWFPSFRLWTNIHLLWGIIGWTLLLMMGVSFQIIPMFYVTPDYPKWVSHFLPVAIFVQLLSYNLVKVFGVFSDNSIATIIQLIFIAVSAVAYAIYTLYLLRQRKRKARDITIWFWNSAMVNFIITAALFIVNLFYQGQYSTLLEIMIAVIALVGFAMALITGMLLKIIPFLVWLNIQQKWIKHPSTKMPLSNMQQVIPMKIAKRQYWMFITMFLFVLLTFATFQNIWLIKVTALMLIITFSHLFVNLLKARQLYKRLEQQLDDTQND